MFKQWLEKAARPLAAGTVGVVVTCAASLAAAQPAQRLDAAQAKAIDVASLLRDTEAAVRLAGGLSVQASRSTAREGEATVFTVDLPRAGYFNLVAIGADGVPVVLFPNRFQPGNRVGPGRFTLPGPNMPFEVRAAAPYGRTTVSAFLTQEPMNLYTDDGQRNLAASSPAASATRAVETLARLSSIGRDLINAFGTKSFVVEAQSAAPAASAVSPVAPPPAAAPMLAGLVTVLTCAATGPCDATATEPSRILQLLGAIAPGILREPQTKSTSTTPLREMNATGLKLTKVSEGYVPQLYEDAAHFCTIAYGHLLRQARCNPGDRKEYPGRIEEPRGAALLVDDMARAQRAVMDLVKVPLTDGQYAALCDFTYNVGSANLKRSTLLKAINAGNHARVPSQLRRWTQAGGVTFRGLQTRREREIVLYFDGRPIPKSLIEDPDTTPVDVEAGEPGS